MTKLIYYITRYYPASLSYDMNLKLHTKLLNEKGYIIIIIDIFIHFTFFNITV